MRNRTNRFYRLGRWLPGLLGIVLIAGLFFYFLHSAGKQEQQNYEVHEIQAKGEVYSATAIIRSGPGTEYEKIGVIRKFVRHDLILLTEEESANSILNNN